VIFSFIFVMLLFSTLTSIIMYAFNQVRTHQSTNIEALANIYINNYKNQARNILNLVILRLELISEEEKNAQLKEETKRIKME